MSTRSSISKVNADRSITSVYCHSDGYLSYNGKMLLENYSDPAKVDKLLGHGDMSFLEKECDGAEGHSYENRVEGQTVFYGRDRGEEGTEARVAKDEAEFKKQWDDSWASYFYQMREGEWYYGKSVNTINKLLTESAIRKDD